MNLLRRRRTKSRWRRRRKLSTPAWTSISRGPSASCPSASGRSTSTACIRISASSSRSSSRRCSSRYVRPGGTRARPVRGLGDDARPVARERPRRGRWRHRRLQLPAHAREDGALQRVHAREGAPRRLCPSRTDMSEGQSLRHGCNRIRARVVRAAGGGRAPRTGARSLDDYEHADVHARRPRPRRALGAADDALRPRLPAQPAARAVLVPQAQARVPPGRARRALPAPLCARHADAHQGVRARPRARPHGRRCCTATHGSSTGAGLDAVVTSPPYPGLIDYHEQHRYAYELLGSTTVASASSAPAAAGTSRAALDALRRRHRPVLANAAEALRPGAPLLVVVNDRRDLYPADPRACGPAPRRPAAPPREPPHGPPRR